MRHSFSVIKLGRISYTEGLRQQEKYVNIAKSSKNHEHPHLEHSPVYTVGIRSSNYTVEEEERLKRLGADFHRGGLITFHGPGQLVMYPIFHLAQIAPKPIGVRIYVEMLEQVIINCATDAFSINDVGRTENTGVWVEKRRKLAALGVAVSHGVTSHGLALNCNTDLSWYDYITACGIKGAISTSLSSESKKDISPSDALIPMLNSFSSVFQCSYNL